MNTSLAKRTLHTDDELRRSIAVCFFIGSLPVDQPVWHLVCTHYGLQRMSIGKLPASADPNAKELEELIATCVPEEGV
jgi:hypothetical protein